MKDNAEGGYSRKIQAQVVNASGSIRRTVVQGNAAECVTEQQGAELYEQTPLKGQIPVQKQIITTT